MELNKENVALREIILHSKSSIFEISCFDDCLAEGEVDIRQTEGEILKLTKEQFEEVWQGYTAPCRPEWNRVKESMTIGTLLNMKQCYIYPQGIILKQNHITGLCKKIDDFSLNKIVTVKITGYDDLNMWLIAEKI
ncbi:hypothetical protein [Ruminococcus albus]|nr:hypothetical protein [Ruminococcus albus]